MKKQIFFLFLVATTPLLGQKVGRQVLASGGGTDRYSSNLYISSTIGEPVAGTVTGGNRIYNQGFQQSDLTIRVATEEAQKEQVAANVFPNPAKDELVVVIENATERDCTLKLYNLSGQLLMLEKIQITSGEPIRLDVNAMPSGTYLLQIAQNDRRDFTKQVVIQK